MYKQFVLKVGGNKLRNRRSKGIKSILIEHINNNLREYTIITLIFLIGVVFGVIFINKANSEQVTEICTYISNFVNQLKNMAQINGVELLRSSLTSNLLLAILLWFVGSTVIGIPIVYGIIVYRGFCIGYTVAAAIASLGMGSGIIFSLTSMLFQNLLFVPSIIALAVSGIKLYKSIVKDKRKENIKVEITRHTIFCAFMLIVLEISAFIEVYISTNLLQICVKYIQ